jgi:hypothetical protein
MACEISYNRPAQTGNSFVTNRCRPSTEPWADRHATAIDENGQPICSVMSTFRQIGPSEVVEFCW